VLIDSVGSPKNCFTVLADCSFDGSLLPLCLVATGKAARGDQGFGDIGPDWITQGENGWMTGELRTDALRWIRELPRLADRAKMTVLIDQSCCHMTVDVAMEAGQLDMDLIPVPPGSTG
jgi:hypothetical protein